MSPHFIIVASFLSLGGLAVAEPAPPVTLEALRTLLKDPSSEGTSFVVTAWNVSLRKIAAHKGRTQPEGNLK